MSAESLTDRERRLDEAVLAFLKASENGESVDPQSWIDRYPDLRDELSGFFNDQKRLDRLASLLKLVVDETGGAVNNEATVGWAPQAGEPLTSLDGARVLGDYEILEEIGKGGMGRVYKARQRSLKRIVALKMVLAGAHARPEELQRFRSEAEAVARLQHPNIVQIFEVGELDGMPFFSLEFVDGGSLASQLNGMPVPARAAAELTRTMAEAIDFAHRHGIIHRDLKPANVLLTAQLDAQGLARKRTLGGSSMRSSAMTSSPRPAGAVVKITDFGLAKRLDEESGQTKSGTVMGTPSYMAPEQAAGDRHRVSVMTDVYGLGAVFYELLTGRPPFRAATPWETVNQVLRQEAPSPRLLDGSIDRDVETICLKCLQKEPHRRYESAQALADDLRLYLDGKPILARPVPGAVKFWRMCRRHPAVSGSLGFALTALLVLLTTVALFNGRLKRELSQNESINRELQMSLTRQVADRIDSDLRQLTRAPTLMAATLSRRADWSDAQLVEWMSDVLRQDERVFGLAVAMEPGQFGAGREDFAQYVYRPGGRVRAKKLLLPDYKPHYREHRWYAAVKEHQKALWSEPFFDQQGGDILMITYSAPIMRGGRFAGVVTADLSIAYFEGMRKWLDEVKMGKNGYAFVLSPTGTFISHPDPELMTPKKIAESPDFQRDAALRSLTRRLADRETGLERAVDPSTNKASVFYFAPIASAEWSFVAVSEE